LVWTVEVTPAAAKQIKGLGPANAQRIRAYLRDRLGRLEDPRQLGKPLTGSELGQFWRYRMGDYRILCDIQDGALVVLVVEVGHRGHVYRT
jgi:mRNA interferase RelE/StbE